MRDKTDLCPYLAFIQPKSNRKPKKNFKDLEKKEKEGEPLGTPDPPRWGFLYL